MCNDAYDYRMTFNPLFGALTCATDISKTHGGAVLTNTWMEHFYIREAQGVCDCILLPSRDGQIVGQYKKDDEKISKISKRKSFRVGGWILSGLWKSAGACAKLHSINPTSISI